MVDQVETRAGKVQEQWLVDGGFPAHEQIDAVAGKTELYAYPWCASGPRGLRLKSPTCSGPPQQAQPNARTAAACS
jgi:hypothetical protein